MNRALALLIIVGCGYPAPKVTPKDAVVEGIMVDGELTCDSCFIAGVSPEIANPGDTLYLEGTFVADLPVVFASGVTQQLVMLGPHRATVAVPATAGCGSLSLRNGTPMPFCEVPYQLGVGTARAAEVQGSGGRGLPFFYNPRDRYAAVRVDDFIYSVGGNGNGPMANVDQATLDGANGITGFVNHQTLATGRSAASAVHVGKYVYAIGGYTGADVAGVDGGPSGTPLANIERALVKPDSTLATFQTDPSALRTARHSFATAVIGNYIYVFGGFAAGFMPLETVERAQINQDGSIGAFDVVPDVALNVKRGGLSATVIGKYLYLIGGGNTPYSQLATVEHAAIAPDGTLGPLMLDTAMPQTRWNHAAVFLHDTLWLLGGATATVYKATLQSDGTLGAFTLAGTGPSETAYPSLVSGGSLYLVGSGMGGQDSWVPLNASGDLGTVATSSSALVEGRTAFAGFALGGYYYAVGGEVGGVPTASIERAKINPDGTLQAFANITATLPVPLAHATLAVVPPVGVCLFGGTTGSAVNTTIYCAQFQGAGPTVFSGLLTSTARRDASIVVSGTNVFLMGGINDTGPLKSIERVSFFPYPYTVTTLSTQLTSARSGATAILVGNIVYVLGGKIGIAASGSPETGTQCGNMLDDDADSVIDDGCPGNPATSTEHATLSATTLSAFSAGAATQVARASATATIIGNRLYLIGGTSTSGMTNTIERATVNADGTLGTFADTGLTLGTARAGHTAAVTGNMLTVFGGGTTSNEQTPLK